MKGGVQLKVHDFSQSIIAGERGENTIIDYIKHMAGTIDVLDVRDNYEYRKKDVDIIVSNNKSNHILVEIKTDSYWPNNLFYEYMSNLERGTAGCMEITHADYLFYYFERTSELYIIEMNTFREWFHQHIEDIHIKRKEVVNKCTEGTYTSVGYTIPVTFFRSHFSRYLYKSVG